MAASDSEGLSAGELAQEPPVLLLGDGWMLMRGDQAEVLVPELAGNALDAAVSVGETDDTGTVSVTARPEQDH